MENSVKADLETKNSRQEKEIVDKIRDFFHKGTWYQITVRGIKGLIKEIVITETKHFD